MSHGYVRVSVLTNEVSVDGTELALPDRESELLTLLACCGGYADAEALARSMWPEHGRNAAFTALWNAIGGLRRLLPDPSMLHSEKNGYALDASISIDLCQIDGYLRAHRYLSRPRCSIDTLLYRRLVRFEFTHRFRIERWAWALPIRSLIDTYRRDVGLWLGWGLLAEGRIYEAHSVATQVLATYPTCPSTRGLLETAERRITDTYLVPVPKAV